MAHIVFVHGGEALQRSTYRDERRGYWSSAFPLVLEKHGFLDVEERPPGDLADPELWRGDKVILVARLPAENWSTAAVAHLAGTRSPVVLEAPFPPPVAEVAGITAAARAPTAAVVGGIGGAAGDLARGYGSASGGRISSARSRPVPRNAELDWTAMASVPITNELATAWRKPGWDIERWTLQSDVEVLSNLQFEGADPAPAIIRRANICAFAWSVFGHLAQAHTSEPWEGDEFRNSGRVTGLETALLGIIDEMHLDAGLVRARMLPWPRGVDWVLNVRHDVDRFMTEPEAVRIAEAHAQAGTVATWYWRARHLHGKRRPWAPRGTNRAGRRAVRAIKHDAHHEVALHTEMLWSAAAERERRTIERAIGSRVAGTCSHGDPNCFRFQGAPNVLWAETEGMLYTELLQHAHFHPHRFPALSEDGTIAPLEVICLPHHESFDTGTEPDQFASDRILEMQPIFAASGGMMQVMSHPDIHVEELFDTLHELPGAGRTSWTASRAADWWRRSHTRAEVKLELRADGSVDVRSRSGIEDAVAEILTPDGARRRVLIRSAGAAP